MHRVLLNKNIACNISHISVFNTICPMEEREQLYSFSIVSFQPKFKFKPHMDFITKMLTNVVRTRPRSATGVRPLVSVSSGTPLNHHDYGLELVPWRWTECKKTTDGGYLVQQQIYRIYIQDTGKT